MRQKSGYRWFVKKDIDGFFGLAIDNLIQLILIATFCKILLGMPDSLVFYRILPGAALSILLGNLFYSWQAYRLAERTGRDDVTALPYGINTVSLFAYIFFIMLPVYRQTQDPYLAWKVGLLACFLSGVIELAGAFIAERIRRATPRAALLSTLAGIAITFISMDFAFKTFDKPYIAMIPLAIILIQYFSKIRFPFGLSGGLIAIITGTALGWILGYMDGNPAVPELHGFRLIVPRFNGQGLWNILKSPYLFNYLSIIIPMGIFNVVGSLQNIESAEAGGDKYNTMASLSVNGIGSIAASLLGSAFPTTIYIGHPGWKGLGARCGYSALNGVFVAFICLTGTIGYILKFIPLEAGIGILLWIGVVITAQAFQETPKRHAPAVAIGLFPAIAAWGLLMVENALRSAGTSIYALGKGAFVNNIAIHGLLSLERGFIFTSMILSSISVFLIEREFLKAALWSLAAFVLSYLGIIHAYKIIPGGVVSRFGLGAAGDFAKVYLGFALLFLLIHLWARKGEHLETA